MKESRSLSFDKYPSFRVSSGESVDTFLTRQPYYNPYNLLPAYVSVCPETSTIKGSTAHLQKVEVVKPLSIIIAEFPSETR